MAMGGGYLTPETHAGTRATQALLGQFPADQKGALVPVDSWVWYVRPDAGAPCEA